MFIKKSLRHCALDDNSLSIGRVKERGSHVYCLDFAYTICMEISQGLDRKSVFIKMVYCSDSRLLIACSSTHHVPSGYVILLKIAHR